MQIYKKILQNQNIFVKIKKVLERYVEIVVAPTSTHLVVALLAEVVDVGFVEQPYKVALCLTVLVEQLVLHRYHIVPHKTHRIFAVYIHRTFFLIVSLKERKKKKEPKKKRRKNMYIYLFYSAS